VEAAVAHACHDSIILYSTAWRRFRRPAQAVVSFALRRNSQSRGKTPSGFALFTGDSTRLASSDRMESIVSLSDQPSRCLSFAWRISSQTVKTVLDVLFCHCTEPTPNVDHTVKPMGDDRNLQGPCLVIEPITTQTKEEALEGCILTSEQVLLYQ
jgi:hypothetical protein